MTGREYVYHKGRVEGEKYRRVRVLSDGLLTLSVTHDSFIARSFAFIHLCSLPHVLFFCSFSREEDVLGFGPGANGAVPLLLVADAHVHVRGS